MYGLDVQEHLTQGNEGKFRIIVQQCPLLIKYLDNKRLLGWPKGTKEGEVGERQLLTLLFLIPPVLHLAQDLTYFILLIKAPDFRFLQRGIRSTGRFNRLGLCSKVTNEWNAKIMSIFLSIGWTSVENLWWVSRAKLICIRAWHALQRFSHEDERYAYILPTFLLFIP